MANLIEIDRNSYVRISSIEAIEEKNGETFIYTPKNTYKSTIPIQTLRALIDIKEELSSLHEEPKQQTQELNLSKQYVSL